VLQPNAEGQVYRAATRFALIAAAGELATSFGITGWPTGEATKAAKSCFQAWISARGGYGSHEEQAIISQVKRFFELHGAVRFANWGGDSETDKTVNRCGYRKLELGETEFLVFPESFKNDLAAGFDPGRVAEVCIQHGMMRPCSKEDKTHSLRPPGMKKTVRFYVFTEAVLGGEE